MPDEQNKLNPPELSSKLRGFHFTPVGFAHGLPVFQGVEARKELVRRFGLPNAAPGSGETPVGNTRCVFVDDEDDGERIAYHEPSR